MRTIAQSLFVIMEERKAIFLKGQTEAHTRPLHQGPWKASYSPAQQTCFMETQNAQRAAFIWPESNDNLTRIIAALPESISSEGMLNCSFSTHPCHPHRTSIPCLASNKTRQCVFFRNDTLYMLSCSMTSLMRAM